MNVPTVTCEKCGDEFAGYGKQCSNCLGTLITVYNSITGWTVVCMVRSQFEEDDPTSLDWQPWNTGIMKYRSKEDAWKGEATTWAESEELPMMYPKEEKEES